MPFDSNGNFSLPGGSIVTTGTTILASQHNTPLSDIAANGLSQVLPKDGRAAMTGDLPMGVTSKAVCATWGSSGFGAMARSTTLRTIQTLRSFCLRFLMVCNGQTWLLGKLASPVSWQRPTAGS